jgi:hypothetical protein
MKRIELTAIVPENMPRVAWLLFLHREKGDVERYEEVAWKEKKTGRWVKGSNPSLQLGAAASDMLDGAWKFGVSLVRLTVASLRLAFQGVRWIWSKPGETIFDGVKQPEVKKK